MLNKVTTKVGTWSKYKNDDTNHMCGLRVKLTYTFSGAGVMAPIFVSVLGLNERERERCQSNSVSL